MERKKVIDKIDPVEEPVREATEEEVLNASIAVSKLHLNNIRFQMKNLSEEETMIADKVHKKFVEGAKEHGVAYALALHHLSQSMLLENMTAPPPDDPEPPIDEAA